MKLLTVVACLILSGVVYASDVAKSTAPTSVPVERMSVQIVREGQIAGILYLDTFEFFGNSQAAMHELWDQLVARQKIIGSIAQILVQSMGNQQPAQQTVVENKSKTKKK